MAAGQRMRGRRRYRPTEGQHRAWQEGTEPPTSHGIRSLDGEHAAMHDGYCMDRILYVRALLAIR